jgi:hypothetical protein
MKVKYLSILLLLFLCEFASGQVPGMPIILGKGNFPQVFTLSATLVDISSANVSVQILNNGQTPVTETGVIWGTSIKDYNTATTEGTIVNDLNAPVGTFSKTIGSLSVGLVYYILAYAKNSAGITYGNAITYQHAIITTATGKTWLMVNLGATAIPATQTDEAGYGFLYQWGRGSDGHQVVRPQIQMSGTTSTRSTGDLPNNGGLFITGTNSIGYNWRETSNEDLWVGINGTNNPCPPGFRLPTKAEFVAETDNWNNNPFGSLKLTLTGERKADGLLRLQGTSGRYWISPSGPSRSNFLIIFANGTSNKVGNDEGRVVGMAVRCIRD